MIKNTKYDISNIISWESTIKKKIDIFHPDITSIKFNYSSQLAQISYKLDFSKLTNRNEKIVFPLTGQFKIIDLIDINFKNFLYSVKCDTISNQIIIDPRNLSNEDIFMLKIEGNIEKSELEQLVYIKPTTNMKFSEEEDRYWVSAMIKDMEKLEKIYHALEVNNINCKVDIAIENSFKTQIPKSLKRSVDALNAYLHAGYANDRKKLFRAWRNMKLYGNIDRDSIIDYFDNLIEKLNLKNYVEICEPYYCGEITKTESNKLIPSNFLVEAITNLSFKTPTASGYVVFKKKPFQDIIKIEMENNQIKK